MPNKDQGGFFINPITVDNIINTQEADNITVSGVLNIDQAVDIFITIIDKNGTRLNVEWKNSIIGLDGHWEVGNIDISHLVDGDITIEATVSTQDFGTIIESDVTVVKKDTIAPQIPILVEANLDTYETVELVNAGEFSLYSNKEENLVQLFRDLVIDDFNPLVVFVLPTDAEVGDIIKVYNFNQLITQYYITNEDIIAGKSSFEIDSLEDGEVKITLQVEDSAGNNSSLSNPLEFNIYTQTEDYTITIDMVQMDDNIVDSSEVNSVSISGSSSAPEGTEINIQLFHESINSSDTINAIAVVDANGRWTLMGEQILDISSLEDGNIIINAQIPFHQDNVISASSNIVKDTFESEDDPLVTYQYEEELVNEFTQNYQTNSSVMGLNDGGYVIVWQSNGQDGNEEGIYLQRYNANSEKIDDEILINTTTEGSQYDPSISSLDDGGYIVTWTYDNNIYMQRFDENNLKVGSETLVNSENYSGALFVESHNSYASVTSLNDGGYVVSWTYGYVFNSDIHLQRFDNNGDKIGDEVVVNTYLNGSQSSSEISSLADGGYVVTWQSYGQDGSFHGIYSQRYDVNGEKFGDETQVNTTTEDSQYDPSVTALADGGYIICWTALCIDGREQEIFLQRFDENNQKVGDEIHVNTYTDYWQKNASVTSLVDGGYVVTWQSYGQDGSSYGIYYQRFDYNGQRIGFETQVNTYTLDAQSNPSVSSLNDGGYVITWNSNAQDGSDDGIYQQRFEADSNLDQTEKVLRIYTPIMNNNIIDVEESSDVTIQGTSVNLEIESEIDITLTNETTSLSFTTNINTDGTWKLDNIDTTSLGNGEDIVITASFGEECTTSTSVVQDLTNTDIEDNISTTAIMEVGETFQSRLEESNDVDWIKILLQEGETYDFTLTWDNSNDIFIKGILDREGNYIQGTSNEWMTLDNSRVLFTARETAEYFISIDGNSFGRELYSLEADVFNGLMWFEDDDGYIISPNSRTSELTPTFIMKLDSNVSVNDVLYLENWNNSETQRYIITQDDLDNGEIRINNMDIGEGFHQFSINLRDDNDVRKIFEEYKFDIDRTPIMHVRFLDDQNNHIEIESETSDISPTFVARLADHFLVGDVIKLSEWGDNNEILTYTLTQDDLDNGEVRIENLPMEEGWRHLDINIEDENGTERSSLDYYFHIYRDPTINVTFVDDNDNIVEIDSGTKDFNPTLVVELTQDIVIGDVIKLNDRENHDDILLYTIIQEDIDNGEIRIEDIPREEGFQHFLISLEDENGTERSSLDYYFHIYRDPTINVTFVDDNDNIVPIGELTNDLSPSLVVELVQDIVVGDVIKLSQLGDETILTYTITQDDIDNGEVRIEDIQMEEGWKHFTIEIEDANGRERCYFDYYFDIDRDPTIDVTFVDDNDSVILPESITSELSPTLLIDIDESVYVGDIIRLGDYYTSEELLYTITQVDIDNGEVRIEDIQMQEGYHHFYIQLENSNGASVKTEQYFFETLEQHVDRVSDDITTQASIEEGTVFLGNVEENYDQDWIKVSLVAGETYEINLTGDDTIDPYIRGIHDSEGNFIEGTANDDGGGGNNARVVFTPTITSDYFISAGAYSGYTGTYNLEVNNITSLIEIADDMTTTATMEVGELFENRIEESYDQDWIKITLEEGQTYEVNLKGSTLTDTYLRGIYDNEGNLIEGTQNDDGGEGFDSKIIFTSTQTSEYYINVSAYSGHVGTYSLEVDEFREEIPLSRSAQIQESNEDNLIGELLNDEEDFDLSYDDFALQTQIPNNEEIILLDDILIDEAYGNEINFDILIDSDEDRIPNSEVEPENNNIEYIDELSYSTTSTLLDELENNQVESVI
jgi:hypothetical protein